MLPGKLLSVLALAAALGSCAAPERLVEPTVEHVVLCWLVEPVTDEAKARVIAASEELVVIPEVLSVTAGTALPSEREIVDDSFDVGIVIGFRSEQDLATYLVHPEHVSRVEAVFGPLSERILIYDVIRR